ncbi:MAG: hypothetical protein RL748_1401, partial [Pseudomonadota bacterium]
MAVDQGRIAFSVEFGDSQFEWPRFGIGKMNMPQSCLTDRRWSIIVSIPSEE